MQPDGTSATYEFPGTGYTVVIASDGTAYLTTQTPSGGLWNISALTSESVI